MEMVRFSSPSGWVGVVADWQMLRNQAGINALSRVSTARPGWGVSLPSVAARLGVCYSRSPLLASRFLVPTRLVLSFSTSGICAPIYLRVLLCLECSRSRVVR
jgi:hypothetical protein